MGRSAYRSNAKHAMTLTAAMTSSSTRYPKGREMMSRINASECAGDSRTYVEKPARPTRQVISQAVQRQQKSQKYQHSSVGRTIRVDGLSVGRPNTEDTRYQNVLEAR